MNFETLRHFVRCEYNIAKAEYAKHNTGDVNKWYHAKGKKEALEEVLNFIEFGED